MANLRSKGDYYDTQPDEKECMTKMKDVRFSTELRRIRTYKKVAQKTVWYNNLLHKILEYQIGEKPLVLYALGKSRIGFLFTVLDSIKNVINSGCEFTRENQKTLMTTFDEFDRTKPEVQL